MLRGIRKTSSLLFLIFLTGFSFLIARVEAVDSTKVSIIPESQSISVAEFSAVNITVTDVTDLFAWQVYMYYDPMILNLTGVTLPAGHVFEGKDSIEIVTDIGTWSKILLNETTINFGNPIGTVWSGEKEEPYNPPPPHRLYNISGWLDEDGSGNLTASDIVFLDPNLPRINEYYRVTAIRQMWDRVIIKVEIGYVGWGGTLLGSQSTFNGSGTLCQFQFSGLSAGNSTLKLSLTDTFLLDSNVLEIPHGAHSSSILVTGPARMSSTVSIEVNATSVLLGSITSISGQIIPLKTDKDVLFGGNMKEPRCF